MLEAFGEAQSSAHGLKIETAAYPSHDPATDLDQDPCWRQPRTGAPI